MKVIIQLSDREETRALPIILRHSPGMILPNRTYILSEDAVRALHDARIRFTEISREGNIPTSGEMLGERI